jgi:hypothetical protein
MLQSEDKPRVNMPLVVVSSHRKIMKLANNQAKKQLESERLEGSLWDQDAISNAMSHASSSLKAFSEDEFGV